MAGEPAGDGELDEFAAGRAAERAAADAAAAARLLDEWESHGGRGRGNWRLLLVASSHVCSQSCCEGDGASDFITGHWARRLGLPASLTPSCGWIGKYGRGRRLHTCCDTAM